MHNVRLHIDDHLTLVIRSLKGKLVPTSKSTPPSLDDKNSFTLAIEAGQVATSAAGLTYLLNQYVFAYPNAPVTNIEVAMQRGRMKIKGKLPEKTGTILRDAGRYRGNIRREAARPSGQFQSRASAHEGPNALFREGHG